MNAIAISQPTNPLINVFNTIIDGVTQLAVNARDLHAFLKVGRDFSTWIKNRIEQYVFIENVDYILTLTKTGERKNVVMTEYYLALDMAKELAMVENNEEGRKVRRYFIRCEHDLYKSDSEKRKILVAACTKLSAGNMPISDVYKMVGGQFGYNNVVDIPTPLLPEAIAFTYEMILLKKSYDPSTPKYYQRQLYETLHRLFDSTAERIIQLSIISYLPFVSVEKSQKLSNELTSDLNRIKELSELLKLTNEKGQPMLEQRHDSFWLNNWQRGGKSYRNPVANIVMNYV